MENSWTNELTSNRLRILAGGFGCRLTPDEANQWTEHIYALQEYEDLGVADAVLKYSIRNKEENVAHAARKHLAANKVMYAVAREWYTALKKQRAAEEPE